MGEQRSGGTRSLADQVMDLADEVKQETTHREKERSERAAARAIPNRTRERVTIAGLVIGIPVLAALVVANVQGVDLMALLTPAPSPEIALRQGQQALDSVVEGIEGFREDHSALPDNLMEVGVPAHGEWTYTKLPGGFYQVVLREYGQVLTFDSHQPKARPKSPETPRP
jgi:hypothetical protein